MLQLVQQRDYLSGRKQVIGGDDVVITLSKKTPNGMIEIKVVGDRPVQKCCKGCTS